VVVVGEGAFPALLRRAHAGSGDCGSAPAVDCCGDRQDDDEAVQDGLICRVDADEVKSDPQEGDDQGSEQNPADSADSA
jgi:hypothetical protein